MNNSYLIEIKALKFFGGPENFIAPYFVETLY
jgi:hypothetical protein